MQPSHTVQWTKTYTKTLKVQFAVYVSETPVTLEQSKGQRAYDENVDPEEGYNRAKFERYRFNSLREKGNVKGFFFKRGNMSVIPLEHLQK